MFTVLQKEVWEAGCKILASLAVPEFKSKDGLHLERGISATLQDGTTSDKVTSNYQQICNSPDTKTGDRKGHGTVFPGLLQQVVLGSQTKQQMEAHIRSEHSDIVPAYSHQMEIPEIIGLSLQQGEWVTSLDFSDAYLHISIEMPKYQRSHLNDQTFFFFFLFIFLVAYIEQLHS